MGELCVSALTALPIGWRKALPHGEWRCRGSMILPLLRPNGSQEVALMEEGLPMAALTVLRERRQGCTIPDCHKLSVANPVVFAGPADQ